MQCRRNCSHKCQFSLIISAFVQKRNLVLSIHLCIIHTYPWTSSFYVETSYDDHKIPESDDWLRSCFWALNKDKENLIKFSQAHGTASKQRQQQRQPYMVKCEDDNIIILMLEKGHNFIRFFIALSAFHRHVHTQIYWEFSYSPLLYKQFLNKVDKRHDQCWWKKHYIILLCKFQIFRRARLCWLAQNLTTEVNSKNTFQENFLRMCRFSLYILRCAMVIKLYVPGDKEKINQENSLNERK